MSEEEVKLLNIHKLQRNDTGDYLCRVLNEYGLADLIHHLVVRPGKKIDVLSSDREKKGNLSCSIRTSKSIHQSINESTLFNIQSITG